MKDSKSDTQPSHSEGAPHININVHVNSAPQGRQGLPYWAKYVGYGLAGLGVGAIWLDRAGLLDWL